MGVDQEGEGFGGSGLLGTEGNHFCRADPGMLFVVVVETEGFSFESGSGGGFGAGRSEGRRFVVNRGFRAAFCGACGRRQRQQQRVRGKREDDERRGGIVQWRGDRCALRSS